MTERAGRVRACSLIAATLLGNAASAQRVELSPIADARLRGERVDQDNLPRKAHVLTARVRAGVKADRGPLQALVETEATLAIATQYNSGLNGKTAFPLIADPQNIELNRAQLRYTLAGGSATVGRQRIELEDQRFVGSASWRQNQQTFDATRIQVGDARRMFVDVTYAWAVRTTNGIDGTPPRPQAIGGTNVFAVAGAPTPVGKLSGFAVLVDQDAAAVQTNALSSQTYGVRLTGSRRLASRLTLAYVGSVARQSGWQRNPNRYVASYSLVEATLSYRIASLAIGREVLGEGGGTPLTSVQAPLGSRFRFNGWAGQFVTTPTNGLRDLYATGAVRWKKAGPFDDAHLSATWHRFRCDRLGQPYGTEWDLLAEVKRGRTALSARYARYRSDGFAADIGKAWLEADWIW